MTENRQAQTTLVLGGTGKTGRRVADRLAARGLPVRVASRSGEPPFDWADQATWEPALRDVESAYLAYYPDIGDPGAAEVIRRFVGLAGQSGLRRLVLLSARGEDAALAAEQAVRDSRADWTVLRASWFCQNFSEGILRDGVLGGEVVFPAGDVAEPFVDAGDIADAAVAALTQEGHAGQIYELTGPRLLTFAEAVAEIGRATGRPVRYTPVSPEQYAAGLTEYGLPPALVTFLTGLFTDLLDGRNARLADGVRRALGREPRDFGRFARDAVTSGAWGVGAAPRPAAGAH
jgi:uncharacterized protein YbjT (DUF2867 family)